MSQKNDLNSSLLIATPSLRGAPFERSVIQLCQYNDTGAMGLMINCMSELSLADVLRQMKLESDLDEVLETPVLIGGPVQPERGFVLHSGRHKWDSSFQISSRLTVTTSRDVLAAMAVGEGPAHALVILGYSGWGPGQLESELRENSWLTAPTASDLLFTTPLESRWTAAAQSIGIDLSLMTDYSGHA